MLTQQLLFSRISFLLSQYFYFIFIPLRPPKSQIKQLTEEYIPSEKFANQKEVQ